MMRSIFFVLIATTACSSALRFVAPDGWAFAGNRVVTTYGADGIISTTDRVASETGVEVLRRGGNAVDAAVATHFALAVVIVVHERLTQSLQAHEARLQRYPATATSLLTTPSGAIRSSFSTAIIRWSLCLHRLRAE